MSPQIPLHTAQKALVRLLDKGTIRFQITIHVRGSKIERSRKRERANRQRKQSMMAAVAVDNLQSTCRIIKYREVRFMTLNALLHFDKHDIRTYEDLCKFSCMLRPVFFQINMFFNDHHP
jgi:hypothetical protein